MNPIVQSSLFWVFGVYARKHLEDYKLVAAPGNSTFQLLCGRTLDKDRWGWRGEPALSSLTSPISLLAGYPGHMCEAVRKQPAAKKAARHSFVCLQTAGTPSWPVQHGTLFSRSIFEILHRSFCHPHHILTKKCVSFNTVFIAREKTPTYSVLVSALLPQPADCSGSISLPLWFKQNDRLATQGIH